MSYHWFASILLAAGLLLPAGNAPLVPPPAPAAAPLQDGTVTEIITVVDSQNVPAGTFASERVTCPDGTIALGGGVDLWNVLTMKVTSSGPVYPASEARLYQQPDGPAPAPVGWQATAVNTTSSPLTMKVAVVCARMTDVTSVVGSSTAPGSTFGAMAVFCPAGKVALGGGVDPENVLTTEVTSSGPRFEPNERLLEMPDGSAAAPVGWQASILNSTSAAKVLKVGVICAPTEAVTAVVSSYSVAGLTFNSDRITCPENTLAIGGGIDVENVIPVTVTSSAPTIPGGDSPRLIFKEDGLNPAPTGYQTSALNRDISPKLVKMAAICVRQSFNAYLPSIVNW